MHGGGTDPQIRQKFWKFNSMQRGNRCTAGKRRLKQTGQALIPRLHDLLYCIAPGERVSEKKSNSYSKINTTAVPRPLFGGLGRFHTETSNVVKLSHVWMSKGPLIPNVSRGSLYLGPTPGVVWWFGLLYWTLAYLCHVVRNDCRNMPEHKILRSDFVYPLYQTS